MKSACAALGCGAVAVFVVAAAALVALSTLSPPPRAPLPPPPVAPPPVAPPSSLPPPAATDPEAYLSRVGARRNFVRRDDGARFQLTYGFIDHHGREHEVSCTIRREDLERGREAFGYVDGEVEREAVARLGVLVAGRVAQGRLEPYFHFRMDGGRYEWEWRVPGAVPEPERSRAIAESRRLDAWIEQQGPAVVQGLEARLYLERGFRLQRNTLEIDYAGVVERATAPLAECARALRQAGAGASVRRTLGLYAAFFQELAYEVPPARERGRETHGLWVPEEVLVRGRGDCDSKSAAFCALWRRFPSRVLFISLPEHALVAVEAKPGPGEAFVRLGNRYYVLCEVAGEAKSHPGARPISGAYEYVAIEPVPEGG